MVEGYAQQGTRDEQYLRSRARASIVRDYLIGKFHLDPQATGAMPLSADSTGSPGKAPWDGVALAVILPKDALTPRGSRSNSRGWTGVQTCTALVALAEQDENRTRSPAAGKKRPGFHPHAIFLATLAERGTFLVCPKGVAVYAQGDAADAIFFVQKGKVRLTVVSHAGKERTLLLVSEGSFFGRRFAGGPGPPQGYAAAMTDCELLRVDKVVMSEALPAGPPVGRPVHDAPVGPQHPVPKRTWSTYCSNRVRGGWPASCSCWRISARMALEKPRSRKSVHRRWPTWSAPRGHASASSWIDSGEWVSIQYNGGQERTLSLQVYSSLLSVVLHDSEARAQQTPRGKNPANHSEVSCALRARSCRTTSDQDP